MEEKEKALSDGASGFGSEQAASIQANCEAVQKRIQTTEEQRSTVSRQPEALALLFVAAPILPNLPNPSIIINHHHSSSSLASFIRHHHSSSFTIMAITNGMLIMIIIIRSMSTRHHHKQSSPPLTPPPTRDRYQQGAGGGRFRGRSGASADGGTHGADFVHGPLLEGIR